jgi:hypothetical protein
MSDQDPIRRDSDMGRLLGMLRGVADLGSYQVDFASTEGRTVVIHTGPNDAVAVFEFTGPGALRTVSVTESR